MGRDTRLWKDGWSAPGYRERDPLGYRLLSGFQPQMINANPPDHRRMRAVYEAAFRPRAVAALTAMIQAEAGLLLDAMPDRGPVDFIESFAGPLPLRVLSNLFELPPSMDQSIARWSAALIKIGDIMMSPEQKSEALAALEECKAYLRDHLVARRKSPGEGLIDAVIAAEDNGSLDEEETLVNLVAMLMAGHETTVTLIGNGLLALLQHPDQMARLRADRELTRSAVEEFMRFEPGGNMILRVAIEDLEVAGTRIPKGSLCIGLIGAINRDPAVYPDPERLDIGRNPNPHFTFGSGIHLCVGAPLARLEGQVAFDALLDRYPVLELDGEPCWRLDRLNARGLGSLPVRVERGAAG